MNKEKKEQLLGLIKNCINKENLVDRILYFIDYKKLVVERRDYWILNEEKKALEKKLDKIKSILKE